MGSQNMYRAQASTQTMRAAVTQCVCSTDKNHGCMACTALSKTVNGTMHDYPFPNTPKQQTPHTTPNCLATPPIHPTTPVRETTARGCNPPQPPIHSRWCIVVQKMYAQKKDCHHTTPAETAQNTAPNSPHPVPRSPPQPDNNRSQQHSNSPQHKHPGTVLTTTP
jgi:hypothetical protein